MVTVKFKQLKKTEVGSGAVASQDEIIAWLQQGVAAAKNNQMDKARHHLLNVVEDDHNNEAAWFWLYRVFDRPDDKRTCLENLILINPTNEWAKQELSHYLTRPVPIVPSRESRPTAAPLLSADMESMLIESPDLVPVVCRRLVTAFWLGISLMMLGSGTIAAGEWLLSGLRSRMLPHYITIGQAIELMGVVIILAMGLMAVIVTLGFYLRSRVGFYGSLILGFSMLLVGPLVSLLITPPNLLGTVCTGGMSGTIILLTLASISEFK